MAPPDLAFTKIYLTFLPMAQEKLAVCHGHKKAPGVKEGETQGLTPQRTLSQDRRSGHAGQLHSKHPSPSKATHAAKNLHAPVLIAGLARLKFIIERYHRRASMHPRRIRLLHQGSRRQRPQSHTTKRPVKRLAALHQNVYDGIVQLSH